MRFIERVGEGVEAGLAVIGKDYRVIWANKRLRDLGVSSNKKCFQIFNKSNSVCSDCGVKKVIEQNIAFNVREYQTINSKGETTWIELRASPLKDKNGATMAALELAIPINERKKNEAELRASEAHYRQLFSSMTEMFQVIELKYDASGNPIDYYYREVNPAFLKLVNKTEEQLIGKRVKELFSIVEDYWLETFDKVAKTGVPVQIENYGAELDKYYDVNVWKIMEKENQVAIIFTDITERRKIEEGLKNSEKKFRSLFENSLDGMIVAKRDGRIISANPAICQMLRMTEKEVQSLGRQGIVVNDKRNIAALEEHDTKERFLLK